MNTRMEFYIKNRPRLAKPYHMKGIGLPNVYLLNGVEIENDPDYGELVTIADLQNLHHAIGFSILTKLEPMTGAELRFLRKQMRLTQEAVAHSLHVNVQTVANYEKGKTANLGPADPMMRVIYAMHVLPEDERRELVDAILDVMPSSRPKPKVSEAMRRKIAGRWHGDGQGMAARRWGET